MTACANLVHSDWVALALVNHPFHFIVGDLESKYRQEARLVRKMEVRKNERVALIGQVGSLVLLGEPDVDNSVAVGTGPARPLIVCSSRPVSQSAQTP